MGNPAGDRETYLCYTLPVARPTRLTPELMEKIVQVVANLGRFKDACLVNGVSPNVGWEWFHRGQGKEKGRPSRAVYREFTSKVRAAHASYRLRLNGAAEQAIRGGVVVKTKTTLNPDGTKTIEETKTPPNGALAFKALQMKYPSMDDEGIPPHEDYPAEETPALKLNVGLAVLLKQLDAVDVPYVDPRDKAIEAEKIQLAEIVSPEKDSLTKLPVTRQPVP